MGKFIVHSNLCTRHNSFTNMVCDLPFLSVLERTKEKTREFDVGCVQIRLTIVHFVTGCWSHEVVVFM